MPTIFILGDSLAADKEETKKPETGWGECLHHYIPDHYTVSNHAINGRSTKSFIDEGRLDNVDRLIKKGDILLIQFGHNDQKITDPFRYTAPYGDYIKNLKKMIDVAMKHHAKPIFITPISRRLFLDSHIIDGETLGDYPDAMRFAANTYKIPLIDMFQTSQVLLSSLGFEGSKRLFLHLEPHENPHYPDGVSDNTHLNQEGAELFSSLIALELKKHLSI